MFHNHLLKPMLLKEVDKPFLDSTYIYELKYDGIRALIYLSSTSIYIFTRSLNNVTNIYPELSELKKIVGNNKVIFDGEIVAFNELYPSFKELQKRSHLKNKDKINNISKTIPVAFIAFDILYENKSLLNYSLIDRKKILNKYKDTNYFIKTKIYQDGLKLFKNIKKLGLEGIVAKQKNSIYVPNKRLDYWVKIKNFQKDKFLIHGFIKKKIKYSLLLGEYKNNELYYVGSVSVMPNNPIINIILKEKKINNLFVNYKAKASFIKPTHKILINYLEKTSNNHLRQPFIT